MPRPKLTINYDIVRALRGVGCTYPEIASQLGMSTPTFDRRVRDDAKLGEALEAGFTNFKISLRRYQMKAAGMAADGKGSVSILIFLGKNYLNQRDRTELEINETPETDSAREELIEKLIKLRETEVAKQTAPTPVQ